MNHLYQVKPLLSGMRYIAIYLGFQEKVIFSSLNVHIRIDPKIEKDGRLRTIFLAKIWHALEYLHEIIQIYITHKRGEEALSQIQE